MERLIGLLHDPIGHRLIDRQGVHGGAIGALEGLLVGDGVELIEVETVVSTQVHGLLGDVLQDLTTGEVAEIAGVVVTHQQLGRLLGHLMDALDVDARRR